MFEPTLRSWPSLVCLVLLYRVFRLQVLLCFIYFVLISCFSFCQTFLFFSLPWLSLCQLRLGCIAPAPLSNLNALSWRIGEISTLRHCQRSGQSDFHAASQATLGPCFGHSLSFVCFLFPLALSESRNKLFCYLQLNPCYCLTKTRQNIVWKFIWFLYYQKKH